MAVPPAPSLTLKVTVALPFWSATGVRVTVRLKPEPPKTILETGKRAGLLEAALTSRLVAAVSTSLKVKPRAAELPSSLTTWSAMAEMVGASFTGVTVKRKLVEAVPPTPSLTVRLIRVVPLWLVAGLIKRARLVPLPPRVMLALGTSKRLVEVALTLKLAGEVSIAHIKEHRTKHRVLKTALRSNRGDHRWVVGAVTVKLKLVVAQAKVGIHHGKIEVLAVPTWLSAGVRVQVRLDPEPPKTIFESGAAVDLMNARER